MKKSIVLSLGFIMCISSTVFASQKSAELPNSSTQIKLTDAVYAVIPTRTEVRQIPGCNSGGEAGQDCTQTVVLESEAMIQANVSYIDGQFSYGEGDNGQNLVLNFKLADFAASEVAALRAVYPTWKHPFSKAPRAFAARNLQLTVRNVEKTIQVVDVRNSKICPIGESGQADGNCVEKLVYKNVKSTAKEVTVSSK